MTRERAHPDDRSVLGELRWQQQHRRRDMTQLFTSTDPDTVAWRREQADVDADIEGLARDEGADRLAAELKSQGVGTEERIERLKEYFIAKDRSLSAER